MNTLQKTETQIKQEQIAIRAYHLWEKEGRHRRHDLEYWLEAESDLGAALPGTGWNWEQNDTPSKPAEGERESLVQ